MSPRIASLKRTFRAPPLVELLVELLVVVMVFALDVRDLSFKTQWIGPKDTFSFTAIGTQVLQKSPLVPAFNATAPGHTLRRSSGWGSFLEKCDTLRPIGGSFFLHAMGENCRFGPRHANVSIPKIMFVSSLRPDSVAWAACKLLRADRRPVVCRSRMVLQFSEQYNMAETPFLLEYASRESSKTTRVPVSKEVESWTSAPGSAAEEEVLELLTVISESAPIGHVVCAEGFIFEGPGRYVSSIYGCGSPNRYHSAFVGIHATAMAQFHQNKSWLTADWLYLLGMPLLIRQNCLSLFNVVITSEGTAAETVTLVHQTLMNFSSSGALYVLVILIDVVLLVVSLLSTIEIVRYIIVPVVKQLRKQGSIRNAFGSSRTILERSLLADYEGVLTCPVIRSTLFAVLTLFSQLISWLVVLANSVIWSWTEATPGKIQAYLSTLRYWTVGLIACNALWNSLVVVSERRAYEFAKRTHVAVVEVLFVASAVAYARRDELFAIGGTKYGLEGQRQLDTGSFQGGFLAFGNAYPQSLDGIQVTSVEILKIIYKPLGKMIGWCLFGAAAFAITRYLVNSASVRFNRASVRASMYVQPSEEATEVTKSSVAGSAVANKRSRVAVDSADQTDNDQAARSKDGPSRYRRLPFEEAVNTPIRARSLLRNTARMETMAHDRQQVTMSALVEHGVIVDRGRLRTRIGFVGTVQDFVFAHDYRMRDENRENAKTPNVLHPLG
ncbi:hypothetical protein ATCC90586_004555 [Pythium insidiosum]|nr:hypothetical protein ATCC90586_004555 [Pythium insidiosum]